MSSCVQCSVPANAAFSPSATALVGSECPWVCNSGFYASAPTALASGGQQCAACTNAPPGAVYTVSGTISAGCPWQCAAGFYLTASTCTPCPIGTYAPSQGQSKNTIK